MICFISMTHMRFCLFCFMQSLFSCVVLFNLAWCGCLFLLFFFLPVAFVILLSFLQIFLFLLHLFALKIYVSFLSPFPCMFLGHCQSK